MTASPHGPYALGRTHATVARTIGDPARGRQSIKRAFPIELLGSVGVRIAVCNSTA